MHQGCPAQCPWNSFFQKSEYLHFIRVHPYKPRHTRFPSSSDVKYSVSLFQAALIHPHISKLTKCTLLQNRNAAWIRFRISRHTKTSTSNLKARPTAEFSFVLSGLIKIRSFLSLKMQKCLKKMNYDREWHSHHSISPLLNDVRVNFGFWALG